MFIGTLYLPDNFPYLALSSEIQFLIVSSSASGNIEDSFLMSCSCRADLPAAPLVTATSAAAAMLPPDSVGDTDDTVDGGGTENMGGNLATLSPIGGGGTEGVSNSVPSPKPELAG